LIIRSIANFIFKSLWLRLLLVLLYLVWWLIASFQVIRDIVARTGFGSLLQAIGLIHVSCVSASYSLLIFVEVILVLCRIDLSRFFQSSTYFRKWGLFRCRIRVFFILTNVRHIEILNIYFWIRWCFLTHIW